MVRTMVHEKTICLHDDLLQNHSLQIKELEARADFKDQRLTSMENDMKDVKKELENINESIIKNQKETIELIKNMQLESNQEDYNIDKRVTSLETTVKVLKWVSGVLIALIPILIALNIIH